MRRKRKTKTKTGQGVLWLEVGGTQHEGVCCQWKRDRLEVVHRTGFEGKGRSMSAMSDLADRWWNEIVRLSELKRLRISKNDEMNN